MPNYTPIALRPGEAQSAADEVRQLAAMLAQQRIERTGLSCCVVCLWWIFVLYVFVCVFVVVFVVVLFIVLVFGRREKVERGD